MDNQTLKAAELVDNVLAQPNGDDLLYHASIYYQLVVDSDQELTNDELLQLTERIVEASGTSTVPVLTAERVAAVRFMLEYGISPNMSPQLTSISAEQAKTFLLTCDPEVFVDLVDTVAVDSHEYYAPETGSMSAVLFEKINKAIGESLAPAPQKKDSSNMSKWFIEVVQDFDGRYYANMTIGGKRVDGLPEYVDYNTLREAIRRKTGIVILPRKEMHFEQFQRKKYAYIDATQERPDCRVSLEEIKAGWQPNFGPVQPTQPAVQDNQTMDLSSFLAYFDFDYDIVSPGDKHETRVRLELLEDGELSPEDLEMDLICLIDKQHAYLGGIDKNRYPVSQESVQKIVERLDVYIQDSVIDEFSEALEDRGVDASALSLGEMIDKCKELNVGEGEVCYALAEVVVSPDRIVIKEAAAPNKEISSSKKSLADQIQSAEHRTASAAPQIQQKNKERL